MALLHEPQRHRHDVFVLRDCCRSRGRCSLDRHPSGAARAGDAVLCRWPRVQCVYHWPRPDHGVLHGHAGDDRRLRQLDRAADDRRARYGLPAHEQRVVLAPAGGFHPALDLAVRGRAARRPRGRRRLDRLRATFNIGSPRPGHGFRHPCAASRRRLFDPRRHQLHHHHLQYARTRHDAAQDAAVCLVHSGDRLPAALVAACARRRHYDAADRPQLRHHVLLCAGWRRSAPLPASVLVLWTP